MRKAWIAATVLVLLALGGYVGWRAYLKMHQAVRAGRDRGQAAVPVEIASVRRCTLRDVGRFTGNLVADSRFIVAPRVDGRLVKLLVNLGDPVRNGQLLAELDDEEYAQQVERAKAELEVAQAAVEECRSNLVAAQREFERVDALWHKTPKIASDSELDQAKAQFQVHQARLRSAEATVNQKQAALSEARIRQSYTRIVAAWEGGAETRYVGERFLDEGALLKANTPIVSAIDISSLIAAVYVIERDYAKIAVGQEAAVTTDAYSGRTFSGRIVRVAPQLQETSRQARVEIRVPNPDGLLKPGMFVRVALEFAEHANATVVPVAALARRGGRDGVFAADVAAGTARFVPLELGVTSGELVEVLRPALKGPIVVMGQHLLEDGSAIAVVPSAGPRDAADSQPAAATPEGRP